MSGSIYEIRIFFDNLKKNDFPTPSNCFQQWWIIRFAASKLIKFNCLYRPLRFDTTVDNHINSNFFVSKIVILWFVHYRLIYSTIFLKLVWLWTRGLMREFLDYFSTQKFSSDCTKNSFLVYFWANKSSIIH